MSWSIDPIAGIGGAEVLSADSVHRLAGSLTPDNTRTVLPGALLDYSPGMPIAERVLGRLNTNGASRFKQYVMYQDDFRLATASSLVRTPGTAPQIFEPRIASREVSTVGYGLRVKATGADIKEADAGLGDILAIKARKARNRLMLQLESDFFTWVTTTANFSTGHSGAAAAVWEGASGDPVGDINTAMQAIMQDCGHLEGGEWVLVCGPQGQKVLSQNADIVNRWNSTTSNQGMVPTASALAQALGIHRVEVMTMAKGPAQATTSMPAPTSNTFLYPSTTTSATLLYVNGSVSTLGIVPNGEFTAAAIVSQYGPQELHYFGGDDVAGPEGQVEYRALFDDWNIVPVAVEDVTTPTCMAGYVLTGIHA